MVVDAAVVVVDAAVVVIDAAVVVIDKVLEVTVVAGVLGGAVDSVESAGLVVVALLAGHSGTDATV